MKTADYWLGEDGTLGFPQVDYEGKPVMLSDLGIRLRIKFSPSITVIVPGYASSGMIVDGPGKAPRHSDSIIAADFKAETVPPGVVPGRYPGVVEVRGLSAGVPTTWRVVEEFVLNVRSL